MDPMIPKATDPLPIWSPSRVMWAMMPAPTRTMPSTCNTHASRVAAGEPICWSVPRPFKMRPTDALINERNEAWTVISAGSVAPTSVTWARPRSICFSLWMATAANPSPNVIMLDPQTA